MLASELILRVQDINKDSGTRWTEAELLRWITDGQREIVRRKPESRYGATIVTTALADITATTDTLDVTDAYTSALADFVLARCFQKDSEDAENLARANQHLQLFAAEMS